MSDTARCTSTSSLTALAMATSQARRGGMPPTTSWRRVDEQPRADALEEAVLAQVAGPLADQRQPLGEVGVDAALVGDDLGLDVDAG